MQRDYKYETDLRAADLDGFGKYPQLAIAIPIGLGVNLKLIKQIKMKPVDLLKVLYSVTSFLKLVSQYFPISYLSISKFFVPKIKDALEDRDNKIKNDIDEASNLKNISEKKLNEYNLLIENARKEVQKILNENKNKLNTEIQNKKKIIDKEIEKEILKAQEEIKNLKKNSLVSIGKISEDVAMKIIEEISGDKLNESSVKAAVTEFSKKNMDKYL